jgi:hypothetical protein
MDKMIAHCGLICTDCEAYKATRTMDHAHAQRVADQWSKMFNLSVQVEHVWCDGCLVGGNKCAHCGECEIRACAEERGVVNCGHCDDFGCDKLLAFFQNVPSAREVLRLQRGLLSTRPF